MDTQDDNVVPFPSKRSIRTFVEEAIASYPRAKGAILFVLDEEGTLNMHSRRMNSRMLASAGARLIYLSGKGWDEDD